jgi:DNA-binding LacI/PurR family transcriptional regulator
VVSVAGEVAPLAAAAAHLHGLSQPTAGDARSAAVALLREAPSAIVCASDALAIEAIAAAQSAGLGVPSDLSVVGFDDSALAAFAVPSLTSVRIDYVEFGEAAALALLACIAGGRVPEYAPSAPELIVRASTGRVPPRWRSES